MIRFFPKVFAGFFNKQKLMPVFQESHVDTSSLDKSLELLNNSSKELIEVACALNSSLKEELAEAKFQLYSIMDSIEDFVLVKDSHGKWKRLNKFGQHLYNLKDVEYLEHTNEEIYSKHPELKDHLITCLETDKIAWQKGTPSRSEESLENRVFDMIKTPVYNSDGSRKELIIVGRDITEIKEKRKRIKACFNALNASNDVIVITDYHNKIFFCNDKFLNKFGFNSFEEVMDRSLDIISTPNHPHFYQDACNKKNTSTWVGSTDNRKQNGEIVHCSVTVLPVMNGVPYPIYYIYTLKPTN